MLEQIDWLMPQLSYTEWLAHSLIFVVNLALLISARPVLQWIEGDQLTETKVAILRALNILVLGLHILDLALLRINNSYQHFFINLGLSFMVIYGGLFLTSLLSYLSRKRFGHEKSLDGKVLYLDTYSSRMIDIVLLTVIIISTVYALIKIWGADSMLEATGIFGILFAFIAFTSNIWAPDIISGLIILNTQMLEDGDVVVIDGFADEYIISKVTLIYVILYDVRNNHRSLIRNSHFTQSKIDNISRIASTDGIRKAIRYKIAYPAIEGDGNRREQYAAFRTKIDSLFQRANSICVEDEDIKINRNRPFEWALTETGDFALEYTLWIFLERLPNTKITATVRKHLIRTPFQVNDAVMESSVVEGLDLSTPIQAEHRILKTQEALPSQ